MKQSLNPVVACVLKRLHYSLDVIAGGVRDRPVAMFDVEAKLRALTTWILQCFAQHAAGNDDGQMFDQRLLDDSEHAFAVAAS
jgi:hypothetical protein